MLFNSLEFAIFLPKAFINNDSLFRDQDHLNEKGANLILSILNNNSIEALADEK